MIITIDYEELKYLENYFNKPSKGKDEEDNEDNYSYGFWASYK